MNRQDGIQARFEAFHVKHPEVYLELVSIARRLKSKGRTHYSMDSLLHVVRYHRDIEGTEEGGYKLNNDFTSRYARLVMETEPDLVGFFETRGLRAL